MSARDTDRLVAVENQSESGYQSIERSTPQHVGDRNITKTKQRCYYKRRLGCAIVFTIVLVLLLPASIWATAHNHYHDATCNSAIPGTYTRSGSYSLLDSSFTLACSKPLNIIISLQNEAASLEIYEVPCTSIEKQYFKESYSNAVNVSVNQPAPLFSEDFSAQNYFLNGSIRVDMVGITTTVTSVGVELCLFMSNDDFEAFLVAGANWKYFIGNAECHSVQVETGDSNSTVFHIREPTFAFMGIATTGNISIGNLTVATNGVEVSGTGENSTKLCQLNGKHPTCSFRVINDEREEFCLVAHEEERSDGSFDYSNLKIKFTTKNNNVRFWVCLSILLAHIIALTVSFCILIRRCYKEREKSQSIMIAEETGNGSSLSTVDISEQSIQNSELQVCTAPLGDQPTTIENQPPDHESDSEAPPDEEPRPPITETYEEPPTEEHPVPPIHAYGTVGTQSSAEVERTVHAQAESDNQSATTAPNGNATELSTRECQRPSINLDQDPLSSEAHSSPVFREPISVKEQENLPRDI